MIDSPAAALAECVARFDAAMDGSGRPLSMVAVGVSHRGIRSLHAFAEDVPLDVRSVSKAVTGLTAGMLFRRGLLRTADGAPLSLSSDAGTLLRRVGFGCPWRGVRLEHLLTHTVGHREGFFFRKDLGRVPRAEYFDYIFSRPLAYPPGEHFAYSNVGPFLISVLVSELTGESLATWAAKLILGPLEIPTSGWRTYAGYTAAATGVRLRCRDLLTLGEALLATGDSAPLASLAQETLRPRVRTGRPFEATHVLPKQGYGLGWWVTDTGMPFCDGSDGQYLIVDRARQLVVAATGAQSDMTLIPGCLAPLLSLQDHPA